MKENRTRIIFMALFLLIIYFGAAFTLRENNLKRYNEAIKQFNIGNYSSASEQFDALGGFKESEDYKSKSEKGKELEAAIEQYDNGNYESAAEKLLELNQYIDCEKWIEKVASELGELGQYEKAISILERAGNSQASQQYKDALQSIKDDTYNVAIRLYDEENYKDALAVFTILNDYEESKQYIQKCEEMIRRTNLSKSSAAGAKTVIGIKNDHTLATSGDISIYNFSTFSDLVSVDVGERIAVGLKEDGTVIITGDTPAYTKPNDWDNIVAISAGGNYIIGLRDDGTVLAQGHNGDKQCNVEDWKDVISIATGWRHTVGLTKDGEILVTGFASEKLLQEIASTYSDWTDVIAIDAGGGGTDLRGHIVGLKPDGTVVAVGDNTYGQCEVSGWTDIVMIAAGDWHTVGLKADGTVVSTMPDPAKEFKGLDEETPLFTGCCNVDNLTDVISISAGTGLTVALKNDGTAIVLGFNDYKQREGAEAWHDMWVIPAIR